METNTASLARSADAQRLPDAPLKLPHVNPAMQIGVPRDHHQRLRVRSQPAARKVTRPNPATLVDCRELDVNTTPPMNAGGRRRNLNRRPPRERRTGTTPPQHDQQRGQAHGTHRQCAATASSGGFDSGDSPLRNAASSSRLIPGVHPSPANAHPAPGAPGTPRPAPSYATQPVAEVRRVVPQRLPATPAPRRRRPHRTRQHPSHHFAPSACASRSNPACAIA
jgi:hypothetical protein